MLQRVTSAARDISANVLVLVGFSVIVKGVALWSQAAAYIVGGIFLVLIGAILVKANGPQ